MELSFLMIRRTKFPWRHAATAYLRKGACARIHFSVYFRGRRVRLHTLKPFRRGQRCDLMSHLRVCTCAPPCVHCALGPPWPILLLFLDNGCIYTLILDYTADLQEGFYKGLAQADSRLNTPEQRAKDCRPVCLCSVRCHKRLWYFQVNWDWDIPLPVSLLAMCPLVFI